tara:strand:- start:221945 stop:222265 length:321 start_codon:yes stop_codon:yes gene_type:complete
MEEPDGMDDADDDDEDEDDDDDDDDDDEDEDEDDDDEDEDDDGMDGDGIVGMDGMEELLDWDCWVVSQPVNANAQIPMLTKTLRVFFSISEYSGHSVCGIARMAVL